MIYFPLFIFHKLDSEGGRNGFIVILPVGFLSVGLVPFLRRELLQRSLFLLGG